MKRGPFALCLLCALCAAAVGRIDSGVAGALGLAAVAFGVIAMEDEGRHG